MKVALVHDWLTGMRGGEKVLEALCEMFPQADIYTLLWKKGGVSKTIESHKICTSLLQDMPFAATKYRYYLPLMPWIISRFHLKGYDLVISSSHCVAKGIKIAGSTPHICYCHTPMRYVWEQYDEYFGPGRATFPVRLLMGAVRPFLKLWDKGSSKSIDLFIANSQNVRDRIKRYYSMDAEVVYPPVDVENYPAPEDRGYYLLVSAFVPYKRIDLVIEAFNELRLPLKIIGSGPEEKKLKTMSKENIEFLGWLSDTEIKEYYSGCRAFIFPQEEDFGITAVEAQAAGKPVIAYKKGGALETVIEGKTGVFFDEQTVKSLINAVNTCKSIEFSSETIKTYAIKFSREVFKNRMANLELLKNPNNLCL